MNFATYAKDRLRRYFCLPVRCFHSDKSCSECFPSQILIAAGYHLVELLFLPLVVQNRHLLYQACFAVYFFHSKGFVPSCLPLKRCSGTTENSCAKQRPTAADLFEILQIVSNFERLQLTNTPMASAYLYQIGIHINTLDFLRCS